jgi:hypothetical protein
MLTSYMVSIYHHYHSNQLLDHNFKLI